MNIKSFGVKLILDISNEFSTNLIDDLNKASFFITQIKNI